MEQYYTPIIDEFHLGFECEYRDNPQQDDWKKVVADADFIGIVEYGLKDQTPPYFFEERFRVKYLDKEDIEAFMWKYDPHEDSCWAFVMGGFNFWYYPHDRFGIIEYEGGDDSFELFKGELYNKSELQREMRKIGFFK